MADERRWYYRLKLIGMILAPILKVFKPLFRAVWHLVSYPLRGAGSKGKT